MSQQPSRSDRTRRGFLKEMAVASATVAGGLSLPRSVHAAGSDLIKLALVGCGGRGTGAVSNCFSVRDGNVKLVAMGDLFDDRLQRSLKSLKKRSPDRVDVPPERQFLGFDAYKQVLATDVDVVMFTTPPAFRPIHYAAAIQAGKNVFLEKPCCVDAPGYRLLMETNKVTDAKGLKVAVGLQRRHSKAYLPKIEQIRDGAVGDLVLVRGYWNGAFMSSGFKDHPNGMGEMEFQIRNWNFFRWISGDHIVEQHVHNLDVCNWAKGDHPIEANGMGGRLARINAAQFDHHFVEFTYPDQSRLYSQCRQMAGCWDRVHEAVHGTKGIMDLGTNGSDGYVNEHADLLKAIRTGNKLNDAWHGATSSMTGVLGRMATYSGRVVKWDDAVAQGPNELPKTFALDANPPIMPNAEGGYDVPVPGVYRPY